MASQPPPVSADEAAPVQAGIATLVHSGANTQADFDAIKAKALA